MEQVLGSFGIGNTSIQLLEEKGRYKVKQLLPDSRIHFISDDRERAFEEFLDRTQSELKDTYSRLCLDPPKFRPNGLFFQTVANE